MFQIFQPNPTSCVKEMSKILGQRDSMLRNAALKALTESFFQVTKMKTKLFLK